MKTKAELIESLQDEITSLLDDAATETVSNSTSLDYMIKTGAHKKAEQFAAQLREVMRLVASLFVTYPANLETYQQHVAPLVALPPTERARELKLKYAIYAGFVPKGLIAEKAIDIIQIPPADTKKIEALAEALNQLTDIKTTFPVEMFWAGVKPGFRVTDEITNSIEAKYKKVLGPYQVKLLAAVATAEVAFQEIYDLLKSGSIPEEYLNRGHRTNSHAFKLVVDVLSKKLATLDRVQRKEITTPDLCPTLVTDLKTL